MANAFAFIGFGVRDSAYISNFIIILAAGLLLGWRAASVLTFMTILAGVGLAFAESNNLSPTAYYDVSPAIVIQDMGAIFFIYAVIMFLLISGMDNALKRAKDGKDQLEVINRELHESQISLEKNQKELVVTNQLLTLRTERISAIAELSKTITSIQDTNVLLSSIVRITRQRFGYHHIGIYLLDGEKQFAVLRASNSNTESQQDALAHGHRLKIGTQNIVGFVASRGSAHIVSSTGEDTVSLNNTDLPETQSEIALPLKLGYETIGVLDIHSIEQNAFSMDDVEIFSILADQVAVAIQNTRSREQTQRALHELEIASRQMTGQAWAGLVETVRARGYSYDGIKPEPVKESSKPVDDKNSLIIPVRIRGKTIGRIKLKASEQSRKWTEDELAIIESTAERVAIALDGARLLEDAQKRASRETFLSEMAAKLGTSFQMDSILRDTVEELGNKLKGSRITFQLVNPSSPPEALKENGNPKNGKKVE
ncbi:MAG TPA: hypothetical protein DCX53_06090 [Anaerolineae bacterium]|nr:hypothetical protein [Anaerolineae bacterium]